MMDVNLCVLYYTDKFVIEKFTGVLDEDDCYIDFDEYIHGFCGISYANLNTITDGKVFCIDTEEDITESKQVFSSYLEDKIEDLEREIDDLNHIIVSMYC